MPQNHYHEERGAIMEELIKRINELSQKARTIGLTESEKLEREQVRREYINRIKANLAHTIANTTFVDEDGHEIDVRPKKDRNITH